MRPIGLGPNSIGLVSLKERIFGHMETLREHWTQRKGHRGSREGGYLQAKKRGLRKKVSRLPH